MQWVVYLGHYDVDHNSLTRGCSSVLACIQSDTQQSRSSYVHCHCANINHGPIIACMYLPLHAVCMIPRAQANELISPQSAHCGVHVNVLIDVLICVSDWSVQVQSQ
jgi:hypothetical protein